MLKKSVHFTIYFSDTAKKENFLEILNKILREKRKIMDVENNNYIDYEYFKNYRSKTDYHVTIYSFIPQAFITPCAFKENCY